MFTVWFTIKLNSIKISQFGLNLNNLGSIRFCSLSTHLAKLETSAVYASPPSMLSRLSPILRHNRLFSAEARAMTRASLYHHARVLQPLLVRSSPRIALATTPNLLNVSSSDSSSMFHRRFHALRNIVGGDWKLPKPAAAGRVFAERREYRKMRKRAPKRKQELELSVSICIEEQLPDDTEIQVLSL